MNLNDFAQEVHALAVEKGFYAPEPTDAELIAAIHSEISEAFEEWRNNQPMVWYECNGPICIPHQDEWCAGIDDETGKPCLLRDPEPHGIAAELIDVTLRVLDFIAGHGLEFNDDAVDGFADTGRLSSIDKLTLPELVLRLHYGATLCAAYMEHGAEDDSGDSLNAILAAVFAWLRAQGIDPEPLLREKHEYNQTRPYRHGGKRA